SGATACWSPPTTPTIRSSCRGCWSRCSATSTAAPPARRSRGSARSGTSTSSRRWSGASSTSGCSWPRTSWDRSDRRPPSRFGPTAPPPSCPARCTAAPRCSHARRRPSRRPSAPPGPSPPRAGAAPWQPSSSSSSHASHGLDDRDDAAVLARPARLGRRPVDDDAALDARAPARGQVLRRRARAPQLSDSRSRRLHHTPPTGLMIAMTPRSSPGRADLAVAQSMMMPPLVSAAWFLAARSRPNFRLSAAVIRITLPIAVSSLIGSAARRVELYGRLHRLGPHQPDENRDDATPGRAGLARREIQVGRPLPRLVLGARLLHRLPPLAELDCWPRERQGTFHGGAVAEVLDSA